jgi:hypothetical protein
MKAGLWAAAKAVQKKFPLGSRHLRHFLGNTGKELWVDVYKLRDAYPPFDNEVAELTKGLFEVYWEKIKAKGKKNTKKGRGEITFKSTWRSEDPSARKHTDVWLALGKFSWAISGRVYKNGPDPKDGKMEYYIHVFDRYNWDASFTLAGLEINGEIIRRQHRVGLAREYISRGKSNRLRYPPKLVEV